MRELVKIEKTPARRGRAASTVKSRGVAAGPVVHALLQRLGDAGLRSAAQGTAVRVGSRGQSAGQGLRVGRPDDRFEREASQAAHDVVRGGPAIAPVNKTASSGRRRIAAPSTTAGTPTRVARWLDKAGAGSPLAEPQRIEMERRLGADFRDVRIHTGDYHEHVADLLGAKAFTYKNHIFLGRGQSVTDPGLMAHELTHTLQQSEAESPELAHCVQREIDFPRGSGYQIGDIMEGSWYEADYRLDYVRSIDYSWSEWPTGLCRCNHRIKVRVEEYSTVGFVGAINKWDYAEKYYWNHETTCTGQEGACSVQHVVDGPRRAWRLYDEKDDAPQSNNDTLSLIGTIASIASLVATLVLASADQPANAAQEQTVA